MPLSTTHALVPIAAAVAFGKRPLPWKLLAAAAAAAAVPDIDTVAHRLFHIAFVSVYSHRGFTHSLFFAVAVGFLASLFHRRLAVSPLGAGVVVGASMASHGLLDMMTTPGLGVAYLWPLSSQRLSADWRPIQASQVQLAHIGTELLPRLWSELWQLIVPMFAIALAIRMLRILMGSRDGLSSGIRNSVESATDPAA